MKIRSRKLAFGLVLLGLVLSPVLTRAQAPAAASGDTAQAGKVAVELFQAPKPKPLKSLDYPQRLLNQGKEGWVNLSMMVDPQGKPYEMMVMKSSGDREFEVEALRAAKSLQFEPALAGDNPIDSAMEIKITFQITDAVKGAADTFVLAYRKLSNALEAKDRTAADNAMAKLQANNLYEDAYLGFAQYLYAQQWGSRAEQLEGLERAVAFEKESRFLPKAQFSRALRAMFALQIDRSDYAGALQTWGLLSDRRLGADAKLLSVIRPLVDEINTLRTDSRSITVKAVMQTSSWSLSLLKHKFQVAVNQGHIAEVKLRCDKKYVFFVFDPTLQYTVSPGFGQCQIELVGDPGTEFALVQS
jgi:TonB family protein